MSDQPESKSRRHFLSHTLTAVPAVGLLGTGAVGAGVRQAEAQERASSPEKYEPKYFTAAEWAFVNAAVDRLIPSSEEGPGALELDVARFIDRELDGRYGHGGFFYMHGPFVPDSPPQLGYQLRFTPRELYRTGIASVDKWCRQHHGKLFMELDEAGQVSVLTSLEHGVIELDEVPATAFFSQLLQNTKEGYLADPMYGGNKDMRSWKMIGFPGARADFMDFADQAGTVYPFGPVSIKGRKS